MTETNESAPLLEIRNLSKHYPLPRKLLSRERPVLKAVGGVSFDVRAGETLGLVGESGSGKSTLGKLILRLVEPTDGEVAFDGMKLTSLGGGELRRLRRQMQIVYQDPYSSLNPRMKIGDLIGEPLKVQRAADAAERSRRAYELLEVVGLARDSFNRYPHEFSGGQRQRIGIARALALNPRFIVCDEAVSALDVSTQSQILNLLTDIQREFGLTYLFIAHGLSVVKQISDRVAVMYLGRIVELAESHELYRHPRHPYTQALFSAIPIPDPDVTRERIILNGDIPSPANPPRGCAFHTRCRYATAECREQQPVLRDVGEGHRVACHLVRP
ncbi:ABC transporter ATP-binding protein [Paenibacillaceae bacterium WGS1546]|uniref:ABC transporter ATP-binding protein n=1 Tax=Cohnella sp. WGS1546 TaxID=3366810 RepID=UPI00372D1CAD